MRQCTGLAYTYVRNEEDALDIVQESVYKAMKGAGSVKGEAYIKTWLWRIVMNTAVDFYQEKPERDFRGCVFRDWTGGYIPGFRHP